MKIEARNKSGPGKAIYQLIVEAQIDAAHDRRLDTRLPFFRPVSIKTPEGNQYSAFSREISASGIGLIHNVQLDDGKVELIIPTRQEQWIHVEATILWCESCGEGWYVSGGQFDGIPHNGMPR